MALKSISVFCGSAPGIDPIFEKQAYHLGKILATNHIRLVYGGTRIGLMGKVADGVLDNGGYVIGVLPWFLQEKEIEHKDLQELIYVNTLHERKQVMSDLSDGVIAMPGGFGTLEEFFEMITWAQLRLHHKPVALFNVNSYFNHLLLFFDRMISDGFLRKENHDLILCDQDASSLLDKMKNFKTPDSLMHVLDETL
jgi:uncharacterized protein (TIGR00730 family)